MCSTASRITASTIDIDLELFEPEIDWIDVVIETVRETDDPATIAGVAVG